MMAHMCTPEGIYTRMDTHPRGEITQRRHRYSHEGTHTPTEVTYTWRYYAAEHNTTEGDTWD